MGWLRLGPKISVGGENFGSGQKFPFGTKILNLSPKVRDVIVKGDPKPAKNATLYENVVFIRGHPVVGVGHTNSRGTSFNQVFQRSYVIT